MDFAISVLVQVTSALEGLGIAYALVGSLASSIHGLYRSTADIDILADVEMWQAKSLFTTLRDAFYVDEQAIREAIAHRRSFNAIHYEAVFKVDIFISPDDDFSTTQLQRRQLRKVPGTESQIFVTSAEDTVLAKLKWYRTGNETSNTQWTDVVGILAISRNRLDLSYMTDWANQLGVADLLAKAIQEAT
jgi:hypothetical protein